MALKSMKKKRVVENTVLLIVFILFAAIMSYPLFWMLSASVKENQYIYNTGLIPPSVHFSNYAEAFRQTNLTQGLINSFCFTAIIMVASVLTATMAAFAFAKLKFRLRSLTFMLVLSTNLIPYATVLLPQYGMFVHLGLLKSPFGYLLPRLFGNAITIFFIKQYMELIPDSLFESAKIDGAGYFRRFFVIAIPLAMPAIATQLIMSFISNWNDYIGPLFFLRRDEWATITLVIAKFNASVSAANKSTNLLMASSVVALLPILAVFAVFQKQIINSVMTSGIK